MKRIVKEISDWCELHRIVSISRPNQNTLYGQIEHVNEDFIAVKIEDSDKFIDFCKNGTPLSERLKNWLIIESQQITFEQAFAELELKPVGFIKDNNVMWLYHHPANGMIVVNHNSPWYLPFNKMELCKIEQCDAAYQASSWHDLHLNVIPALMRMAGAKK